MVIWHLSHVLADIPSTNWIHHVINRETQVRTCIYLFIFFFHCRTVHWVPRTMNRLLVACSVVSILINKWRFEEEAKVQRDFIKPWFNPKALEPTGGQSLPTDCWIYIHFSAAEVEDHPTTVGVTCSRIPNRSWVSRSGLPLHVSSFPNSLNCGWHQSQNIGRKFLLHRWSNQLCISYYESKAMCF